MFPCPAGTAANTYEVLRRLIDMLPDGGLGTVEGDGDIAYPGNGEKHPGREY